MASDPRDEEGPETRSDAQRLADEVHEQREEHAAQKIRDREGEILKDRVALAAIVLTTALTFIGNVKSDRDDAAKGHKEEAAVAKAHADELWGYYQTKLSERTSLEIAHDRLRFDLRRSPLQAEDPGLKLESMRLADYDERIHDFDRQAQQVFFRVQDLEKTEDVNLRGRIEPGRAVARYDVSTKLITLALILLSVTILVNKRWLLYVGMGLGFLGIIAALDGWLLLF
jgi:hypothetical protein